jgi:membrane associated rhomboid family serine protease
VISCTLWRRGVIVRTTGYYEQTHRSWGGMWTPAVKNLVMVCVVVYVVQVLARLGNVNLSGLFGLVPLYVSQGWVWQLFTYMFLHGGIFHLIFNMLVLWMFGGQLEAHWGTRAFLKYYVVCGVSAGVATWLLSLGSPIPLVGASGAIFGLLLAYGLLFPDAVIYLYFFFPIKAKYMVLILGGIEFLASLSHTPDGIGHFAHLGGLVAGLIYLKGADRLRWWWGRTFRRRPRPGRAKVVDFSQSRQTRQREEIDAILDKISSQGMGSLSARERQRLREAGSEPEEKGRPQ